MEKKQLMNESGLIIDSIDIDNKQMCIDFSGETKDGNQVSCYRNDASILFFAANSYRESFCLISRELNKKFENKSNIKDIEHLVLPYYFNFRHYVELEIKGLIAALSNESPEFKHDIKSLFKYLDPYIDDLEPEEYKLKPGIFMVDNPDEKKENIMGIYNTIKKDLINYYEIEPTDEYYRYIFEKDENKKDLLLKNSKIYLNLTECDKLFFKIANSFYSLCKEIRKLKNIWFNF